MLSEYIPIENRFLFRKESPLKVNENISHSYKEVLKLKKISLDVTNRDNTILIIPQPFSELNYVTLEDELSVMSSLIKFINKKELNPF